MYAFCMHVYMLCYAMLCYAMLCYAMLCYAAPPSGAKLSGVRLRPTVGSSQFYVFEIHPGITLSTNNQITRCNYYVRPKRYVDIYNCTIVYNVMHLFYDCPKLRDTRTRRR